MFSMLLSGCISATLDIGDTKKRHRLHRNIRIIHHPIMYPTINLFIQ